MAECRLKLAVFGHVGGAWAPAGLLTLVESGNDTLGAKFSYGRRYIRRADALPIVPGPKGWLPNPEQMLDREFTAEGEITLFGAIRDAAPDAWGRRVIEAHLKVPANSLPESRYLLEAGANRAGALDIRPRIESPPAPAKAIHKLGYLLDAAARIEQGVPVPAGLQDIFEAGSGMGGMRPKASVTDDAGQLWLAKFPSVNERLNIPLLEYATLRLAREAGLSTPEVAVETINGKTVMRIHRFDREYPREGQETRRRHMISALTLLGCHESRSIEMSYGDIADAIRRHGAVDCVRADQAELFGRMVFNILTTNDDDHLRNHAFLWQGRGWQLSPLYDVVPRPMLAAERRLHLGVGTQGRAATLDNAMTAYAKFGLDRKQALGIIDRVWTVVRQWKMYFDSYGVPATDIEQIAPAFRRIDDIFSRASRDEAETEVAPEIGTRR